jgi:hypothetical protein
MVPKETRRMPASRLLPHFGTECGFYPGTSPATTSSRFEEGAAPMHGLMLVMFCITAGFTASAIVANLYRISGLRPASSSTRALHTAVLVLAGPSVLFESAMRGFLAKTWTPIGFWLAAAVTAYWSLFVGLLVVDIAIHM